jgi:peptidoglycan/LPS O-acetylase OafA/YrhL
MARNSNVHQSGAKQHRFVLLDLLRGIAALLVVAFHSGESLTLRLPARQGYLAVDLFFVLSGFVIAHSYEDRLKGNVTFRDFTVARVIRLYPMYLLGSALGLLVMLSLHHPWPQQFPLPNLSVSQFVLNALLIPSFAATQLTHWLFPLDIPAWSLSCEMAANLVYAALVRRKAASNGIMASIAGVSIFYLIAFWIRHGPFTLDGGAVAMHWKMGYARVGFSFFVGVLLCRYSRNQARPAFTPRQSQWVAGLACLLVAAVLARPLPYEDVARFACVTLVFPMIVYFASRAELPQTWRRASSFLGDVSYPLYLLHYMFVAPLRELHFGLQGSPGYDLVRLARFPVFLVTVVWLSWLIAEYLDTPVRKQLAVAYNRWKARVPSQVRRAAE